MGKMNPYKMVRKHSKNSKKASHFLLSKAVQVKSAELRAGPRSARVLWTLYTITVSNYFLFLLMVFFFF